MSPAFDHYCRSIRSSNVLDCESNCFKFDALSRSKPRTSMKITPRNKKPYLRYAKAVSGTFFPKRKRRKSLVCAFVKLTTLIKGVKNE